MSVEDDTVIDFIGIEKATGHVVLTISDHLPWNDEHLKKLERKIATYVHFVKSGQLLENRPDAEGRTVQIRIVHKFELTDHARVVLKAAQEDIQKSGLVLSFTKLEELT